jgi:para-nitrobenzyl esterase
MRQLLPALLIISLFTHLTSVPSPIRVTGGLISGTQTTDGAVRAYKGIPFAAPPVGTLRWQAPQPVVGWPGVRACTAFGASPMQGAPMPFGPWSAEYLIPRDPINEDCLYLNVWTGARSAREKRPTLVWIYGGGFGSGGAGCAIYDGEAMARRGIVFVSVNYRVGPFGFLAHPELTAESGRGASGNYGLMDQIAALRWVQQNIAAFGGDPRNVTIAGQSAGSMSVNCLVASPLAKGLFGKAIAQSGASVLRPGPSLSQAEQDGLAVMKKMGASSLAEMRALSADEVLKKAQSNLRGPIVDGYVLPEPMPVLFNTKKQNDIALLTGWNEDEGMAFGPAKTAEAYRQQVEKQYGPKAATYLIHYPGTTDAEAAQSANHASRDQIFAAQNYAWANLQSEQGKLVYVYRFTRKLPATGQYAAYGAFHTGEVAYAYDNLRAIDRSLRPLTATDEKLAQMMAAYWANFCKTGNPNGKGLPNWPRYTVGTKQIVVLGDEVRSAVLPDAARLEFMGGL